MRFCVSSSFAKANRQSLEICKEIYGIERDLHQGEEVVFDFSGYRENNPFSNLLLINTIRTFRADHPETAMSCRPKESGGYLSHIGFYQACGIQYGKEVGEAVPNENYVPVTEINLYDGDFYRVIDEKSKQLSATLRFDSGLQSVLTYFFIETIRNVFEHADTSSVLVAAQKWPSMDLVEIAISDSGCGIGESLSRCFATDEANLLRLACKPGVSARSNYRYLEKDDPWRNSGYGLYIMKELALSYGGSFILCSGGYALRYTADEYATEKEEVLDTDYRGTTIGIRIRTDSENDFDEVRNRIVAIGQLRSEQIKGAIRTASRSSGGRYHM